jgi:hypothetical protein
MFWKTKESAQRLVERHFRVRVLSPQAGSQSHATGIIVPVTEMTISAVASVAGVGEVKVNIVWDPPWDPSRMSDEARAVLNMW